jgi:hypothetical protein
MAQAKRKNTTAFAKTADAKLFKLHDTFYKAYETMQQYEGGEEESPFYRKWQRAVDDATKKARAIVAAPALTLEGMLMKIHVAASPSTVRRPAHLALPIME